MNPRIPEIVDMIDKTVEESEKEERKKTLKELKWSLHELKHAFNTVCIQCARLYEAEGLHKEAPWQV